MLKFAFNAVDDGLVGQQIFAGEATQARLRHRRSRRGPRLVPREARPRLVRPPLAVLMGIIVETSGSSSAPKRVQLSDEATQASTDAANERLGGPGQWVLSLPEQFIAAKNVQWRNAASGADLIRTSGSFTAEAFVEAAQQLTHERRYTSLVPTQLARLVDAAELDRSFIAPIRRFDRILLGGQRAPVGLIERASMIGWSVTRTYGATETCGGCVSGRPATRRHEDSHHRPDRGLGPVAGRRLRRQRSADRVAVLRRRRRHALVSHRRRRLAHRRAAADLRPHRRRHHLWRTEDLARCHRARRAGVRVGCRGRLDARRQVGRGAGGRHHHAPLHRRASRCSRQRPRQGGQAQSRRHGLGHPDHAHGQARSQEAEASRRLAHSPASASPPVRADG